MDDKLEPYEPPTIEDVPLRPEEQLLAACKVSANPPGQSALFGCFGAPPCRVPVGS